MATNQPQLEQIQQQLKADPDYQKVMQEVQELNASGGVWQNSPAFAHLQALNQKYESVLPKNYGIGFDGKIGQAPFMARHDKLLTALSMVPATLGAIWPAGPAMGATSTGAGTGAGAGAGAGGAASGVVGPTVEQAFGDGFVGPIQPTGAAGGGGGILGGLKKLGSKLIGGKGQDLADLGKTLGSFSETEAGNRATTGDFMQNYDRLRLQAQQDNRANESDALKKLAQTSYLQSGGAHFNPSAIQLNSGRMPDFGPAFGPSPASAAQQKAAGTLQGQLLQRLAPGGSYMPTDPTTYTKPGVGENIGKWGSLIAGGMGAVKGIFGKQPTTADILMSNK
jgi:hypothetical protein